MNDLKFILDVHLGKLAKYLRLFGFDSLYKNDFRDQEIIYLSRLEERIILTRDAALLRDKKVKQGFRILSQHPGEQVEEVFLRFNLANCLMPFSRCLICNGVLKEVPKEDIICHLLPRTAEFYNKFRICANCSHVYWEGSHYEHMKKYIYELINKAEHGGPDLKMDLL